MHWDKRGLRGRNSSDSLCSTRSKMCRGHDESVEGFAFRIGFRVAHGRLDSYNVDRIRSGEGEVGWELRHGNDV